MSLFVDQMLVQLSNAAQLTQLVAPTNDPTQTRLRTLLNAVYDLPFASVHEVRNPVIKRTEFQRPLFPSRRTKGTWTQTIPNHTYTDVVYEDLDDTGPTWLDISAEMDVTLVLEVDTGEVASILTREIADFETLADFQARFRFLDLDAFMSQHGITTVEELKEAYHYLLTEIRLREPGPFDPNDPANQHHYALNLAIMIREAIDLVAGLRDAKLARQAVERSLIFRREVGAAEVRTPYAPLLIYPEAALADLPFDADTLRAFFAAEQILVLFVTPA